MKIISKSLAFLFFLNFLGAPMVQAADFNLALTPNDTYNSLQGYLSQIKAPEAWDIIKESPNVVVAVIDSGVDIDHPDLQANIWRNPGEIPGDGLDNDNNGYIDDVNGWDFVVNSPNPRPKFVGKYSKLGINHGTVVAGVIGAIGNNNFGIAGLSWKIKIIPLRVMDGEGSGSSEAVFKAVEYAIKQKVNIINLSMVGDGLDSALEQAIAAAYKAGIVIVAAAGNESGVGVHGEDLSLNLELHPQYPICHDGPDGQNYVLGVGSVDDNDVKSIFSNFGSKCMDLVAPGEKFLSTQFYSPNVSDFRKYFGGYWFGTSVAAPQVSAAAALLKAVKPGLTNAEIYQILIQTADNIDGKNPNFKGLLGSGRLNLYQALKKALFRGSEDFTLTSAGINQEPEIKFFNNSGQLERSFLAYDKKFKGGVNVTLGDLDGNGMLQVIVAPASDSQPIKIFSIQGEFIRQFFAYDKNFKGGVNVISSDLDGDGTDEIITSPLGQAKPLIRIFDKTGKLKKEFLAFKENDKTGFNLALVDLNANGQKEIIVFKQQSSSLVRIFNADGRLLTEFQAFDNLQQSLTVVAANILGDFRDEIIAVENKKSKPYVRIYSSTGEILKQFVLENKNNNNFLQLSINKDNQAVFNLTDKNQNYLSFYSLDGFEVSRRLLNDKNLKNFNWVIY